jgi:hypothetical protein
LIQFGIAFVAGNGFLGVWSSAESDFTVRWRICELSSLETRSKSNPPIPYSLPLRQQQLEVIMNPIATFSYTAARIISWIPSVMSDFHREEAIEELLGYSL